MAYDMIYIKSIPSYLLYIIALILQNLWTHAQGIFLLVSLMGALLLYRHTRLYDTLEEHFKKSRDDSMEIQSLLQEKNRTLIQKQNAEIYAATLKERNRIAREIHDNVGHLLSRSILMTGALKATNIAASPSIQVLEDTLTSAMDSIRNSVHDLHDRSVDLHKTLQALIRDFYYCDISLDYSIPSDMPADIKYTYIAIIKEGLSNIIKHSNATKVMLIVQEHPSLYQLVLHDNGNTLPNHESSGIGLINIRERVDALDGNLQITSDFGFRIFITIPKREETDENTDY